MVRIVDFQSRKKAVLAKTVNKYILEAVPVASEDLAREFNLSSATIRNVFAELEEEGFLTHPYTSGGRIPTNKGYRYYVDFLLSQMELLDAEKEEIIQEYKQQIKRLDDILEKTSEIISKITHYTGIVSLLESQDRFFYKGISYILEQPEFHDYERVRYLVRALEERKRLLDILNRDFSGNIKVYIGEELECPEIKDCSLIVSNYHKKNIPFGRIAVLGPKRMEYRRAITTLEYISSVLTDILDKI